MTTLTGTIDKILFQNTDTAWSAVIIVTEYGPHKASGIMPGLRLGMTARLSGEMESTRYGDSLKASTFEEVLPNDCEGIEKYLASGLIRYIGPKLAKDIVRTFGERTLEVLDNEPERLVEVYGIGKKRVQSVIQSVKEQTGIRQIMIWLKRYDITNGLAAKIYKAYDANAIAMLEENPYRLSDDIGGVGFKKADDVALRLGIGRDSIFRCNSGTNACLENAAATEGHTCLPYEEFIERVTSEDYLSLPRETVENAMEHFSNTVIVEDGYVFLPKYYKAETAIAKRIEKIQSYTHLWQETPDIDALQEETGVTYSSEQRSAIAIALTSNLSIITGGPGTGKTTIIRAIITDCLSRKEQILLAAPTGRAAKRMEETTGQEAKTIHRLLEYGQGGFGRNSENPLDGDTLIVDEASMIDTLLMDKLLAAVRDSMRVVIVGDVDQLPSVGAGCVLRDLIDSGIIPTTRLREIFRQAQGSQIIMNAHAVNTGRLPVTDNHDGTDFWFFGAVDKDRIADLVVEIVSKRAQSRFGVKKDDIQVLSPMKREFDPIGSTQLNRRLQAALNPSGEKAASRGDTEFRVGDRIMQVKNDYSRGIFNGDLGTVLSKDNEQDEYKTIMWADFDGVEIPFNRTDLQDVELAYACTVHKSQGSEYPVVVIPLHESQYIMLKRNLLYTAITRAKKQCIIVGTQKAIAIACNNEDTRKRYTMLKQRIIDIQ